MSKDTMGMMDAKEYDPRPARRRKRLAGTVALLAVVVLGLWFSFRHWPARHAVDRFFRALEAGNFEQAYGLYIADVNWQQRPRDHEDYTLNQFRLDWGPSGEYGAIKRHQVECVTDPPARSSGPTTGVIVVVRINDLSQRRSLWVDKNSKSITVSPLECTADCRQCEY